MSQCENHFWTGASAGGPSGEAGGDLLGPDGPWGGTLTSPHYAPVPTAPGAVPAPEVLGPGPNGSRRKTSAATSHDMHSYMVASQPRAWLEEALTQLKAGSAQTGGREVWGWGGWLWGS